MAVRAGRDDGGVEAPAVLIAYVVDVHDRCDSVRAAVANLGGIDVLVVGGDITTGGTPADAARAVEAWRPLAPRVLALAGNMDSAAIDARLDELGIALDGRGFDLGPVGICGVSAAPRSPLRTPYELDDDELAHRVERAVAAVTDSARTIFCPHAPPSETSCDRLSDGRHVGSAVIRSFVEREQPDLVLCGHIHEARGEGWIGSSRIVNPGPVSAGHYAVVDVDGGIDVRLDS
jgi:Icc-related predicted phosphoesterase